MDSTKVRGETQDKLALERHLSHDDLSPTTYRRLVQRGYLTTDGKITPKGSGLLAGEHWTQVTHNGIEISIWQDDHGRWSYMFSNGFAAGSSEGYESKEAVIAAGRLSVDAKKQQQK